MDGVQCGSADIARFDSLQAAQDAARSRAGSEAIVQVQGAEGATGFALRELTFDSAAAQQRFLDAAQTGHYPTADESVCAVSFVVAGSGGDTTIDVPAAAAPAGAAASFATQADSLAADVAAGRMEGVAARFESLVTAARTDGVVAPAELDRLQALNDQISPVLEPQMYGADEAAAATALQALSSIGIALSEARQYDFVRNPAAQDALFVMSPQMAGTAGSDSYDLCGGAVLAASLVADSTTTEAAQQNAAAVRSLARAAHVRLTPEQTSALEHFGNGRMTAVDLQQMQGLMYQIATRVAGQSGGVSSGTMAGMVESLRERGGLAHSAPVITQFHATVSGSTAETDHWVVTTGGRTIDSWPNDGANDHGRVTPGGPPAAAGDTDWRATISSTPGGNVVSDLVMSEGGPTAHLDRTVDARPESFAAIGRGLDRDARASISTP